MRSSRQYLTLTLTLVLIAYRSDYCHGAKQNDHVTLLGIDEDSSEASFTLGSINESESNDEFRYIVKFKNDKSFRRGTMNAKRKNYHVMALPGENCDVMTLTTQEEIKKWEESDDVEYVEEDHKVYLQSESSPYGIDMVKAFEVPDDFVMNRKVCIIDTGYAMGHSDLPGNSVVTGTTDGAGIWSEDGNGHGTHVAGTIAAIGGNNKGVIGVSRNGKLKLHIVRVFNDNGNWAWKSTLIEAARSCVLAGSHIISMSLGGPQFSYTEKNAFQNMYNDGILVIAAAGNDGSTGFSYPASYPSVISVAAIDKTKNLASFSQRNSEVDLAAPGVQIMSTSPGNSYKSLSGTSMATPHVSGVAALVWSHFPLKSAFEIRTALESTADDLGIAGRDNSYGHGLVNAKRAFDFLSCMPICRDSPLGWHDLEGSTYSCSWYSRGENCATYGDGYENNGKTANEACCGCGGGQTLTCEGEVTNSPTRKPTRAPVPANTDAPTMKPTIKPTKAPTNAPVAITDSPTVTPSNDPSKAPTETPVTAPPTRKPTPAPTNSPAAAINPTAGNEEESPPTGGIPVCINEPINWHDSDGSAYNCNWYGNHPRRCPKYGHLYPNNGKTAKQACCTCGGGAGGVACEDVPLWHDKDGQKYNCAWYSIGFRCKKYGTLYANNGHTANTACCACKNI